MKSFIYFFSSCKSTLLCHTALPGVKNTFSHHILEIPNHTGSDCFKLIFFSAFQMAISFNIYISAAPHCMEMIHSDICLSTVKFKGDSIVKKLIRFSAPVTQFIGRNSITYSLAPKYSWHNSIKLCFLFTSNSTLM